MALEGETNIFSIQSKMNEEKNFKVFAQYVVKADVEHAIRVLRDLLDIEYDESAKLTQHIFENYNENPNSLMELMNVREKIILGKNNEALLIVQKVFGVSGPESVNILDMIRSHINSI